MAFSFDDLREKVTDLAQSGVAKSKQLAEIAKLKTSNMGEEDTIKKAYLELGLSLIHISEPTRPY